MNTRGSSEPTLPGEGRRDDGMMCPHCGALVGVIDSLTAIHPLVDGSGTRACPGSQQNPRYAYSDRRPLWNGQPNLLASDGAQA